MYLMADQSVVRSKPRHTQVDRRYYAARCLNTRHSLCTDLSARKKTMYRRKDGRENEHKSESDGKYRKNARTQHRQQRARFASEQISIIIGVVGDEIQ